MTANFGDRLTEANRLTGSVLCMGIDPHCQMIPALFGNATAEQKAKYNELHPHKS